MAFKTENNHMTNANDTVEQEQRQVREVNPHVITTSPMNERVAGADDTGQWSYGNLEDLKDSIEQQGIVQDPVVRPADADRIDNVEFEAIAGSRRIEAVKQLIDEGRLQDDITIDVKVVDWSDSDALLKSMTENVDAFSEGVDRRTRARAVQQLKEINEWNNADVADRLGVSRSIVRNWLEWTDWEGSALYPVDHSGAEAEAAAEQADEAFDNTDTGDSGTRDPSSQMGLPDTDETGMIDTSKPTDTEVPGAKTEQETDLEQGPGDATPALDEAIGSGDLSEKHLQEIRRIWTDDDGNFSKDEGVEMVRRLVADADGDGLALNVHHLEEISQKVDRGRDPWGAYTEVLNRRQSEERRARERVSVRVKFTGDRAHALSEAAEELSMSDEELVTDATVAFLKDRGYYDE